MMSVGVLPVVTAMSIVLYYCVFGIVAIVLSKKQSDATEIKLFIPLLCLVTGR
jgi:hypothetical protein